MAAINKKYLIEIWVFTSLFALLLANASSSHEQTLGTTKDIEEVKVWGEPHSSRAANATNPTSLITQEDIVGINSVTTEDLVKYEPSLVIRRRYIGDANGTLGIRGSNMFATSRSMVFADGVPLHYFLQSRWSGAPRWTMVSASEIAQVEILYGPFSAEYSGNAMGGVVLIETAIPQSREFHFDSNYFAQDFSAYGFDDALTGNKTFLSYGDKWGDLSIYASFNRLKNNSQPMSYYYDARTPATGNVAVNGGIADKDIYGNEVIYFGDSGIEQVATDNFKIKLGYDFLNWSSLLNIALEDRTSVRDQANSYLRDAAGDVQWSGNFAQNTVGIKLDPSRLGASDLQRKSLSLGLRVKGELSERAQLEANINEFRILQDKTLASSANLHDPAFDGTGQTTNFGDTGWQTLEAKLTIDDVLQQGLQLVTGVRHEAYKLNLDVFASSHWQQGDNQGYSSRSGGETAIDALFAQMNWAIDSRWSLALGGRYEHWQSRAGYFGKSSTPNANIELEDVANNSYSAFSPKFSLGYEPANSWLVRYSLARAYRFPIVEELFTQSQSYSTTTVAQPDLQPERGLHHNLLLEKQFTTGYARVNFFAETIADAIESQSNLLPGGGSITTFSAIDAVNTSGVEVIVNRYGIFVPELDMRVNLAYTRSIIADNSTAEGDNPQVTIEGNEYPRIPHWRGNMLLTYHLNNQWDLSANYQYAQKSFGRLDNRDTQAQVMGAQDGYSLWGVKMNCKLDDHWRASLGVDNLTNQLNFVAHPWPGRTVYLNIAYDW